jgi:hypothetical protein
MDILSSKFNFNSLSIKDLVEARDLFHVHLINKKNVLATAVGRYRIRKNEPWPNEHSYAASLDPTVKRSARTLENSHVREYSWPCILVFVEKWEDRNTLASYGEDDIVPRSIYMPDGRIVPICVVEAPRSSKVADDVDTTGIVFPLTFVGGGFPLLIESQGVERIASIGCIVTDGNTYYALTNKHVAGNAGTPVFTKLKGAVQQIGVSSGKQLGKMNFEEIYPDWKGKNLWVNNDIGLIEIEDINVWKTEIIGIGEIEKLADLNTGNISLALISVVKPLLGENFPKVCAFGAVSGKMEGEIVGLFYRYKSLGGQEFISDFLISGPNGADLETRFGDSGTVWLLESEIDSGNKKKYYPFGVHWGQHTFINSSRESAFSYGLATNLTNACVRLDVDIVRGWNLDQDYSWGKSGHFKIAAKSCELVSNTKLRKLLMANQKNIGYVDGDLLNGNVVSGAFGQAKAKFVPLADVADIIWRSTRKSDSANHFADIDETNDRVLGGKSLLKLCKQDENNVDINFWLDYFKKMDVADPHDRPREGALPFRVWQMYNEMISSLNAGDLDKFICAGGTMAHYVGDACQPLHISHLHHGRNASEKNVHSDYETQMVDRKLQPLFDGVNAAAQRVKSTQLVNGSGKNAAIAVVKLMAKVHENLPPEEICISFAENIGKRKKYDNMWEDLGTKTIENIAWGCHMMAVLWESAWVTGKGDRFSDGALIELDQQVLKDLYNDPDFVPSFRMKDKRFADLLV